MISELDLVDIATFTEQTTMKPLKINFCYGSNGSGKTTVSSVIANCPANGAKIVWSTINPLCTLVYNRDFVSANFGETSKIGGIFTLGKDSKEAQEFIAEQRTKIEGCAKQIEILRKYREKLAQEQQAREKNIDDACWIVKSKYDHVFDKAFLGLNNSKSKFRERCLVESKNATETQPNIDELKRLYGIAFGETRQIYQTYLPIDVTQVEQWEKCGLLSQKISGSADTATLTSVKPTVEAINTILARFGFEGFSIAENQSEYGTYKIIRADGNCVENTLSEGEYNFISFLYFYHLVYGSPDKTGIAQPKVVVIDDPISSLDSNVLFIVSTLTKQIINDCKNDHVGIKQVFILTHNVYFHKEVTFLGNGKDWKKNEAAFWIIKKSNNISRILDYKNKNPIQTSYELLWSELEDIDSNQRITIFNTLRRILEYYFNVIGGLDYEKCINEFEGEDKLICKSLISCINEGSHFITDDFVMQYESATMNSYIRVFKLIFQKMGHESHYNMMMKGENPEAEQKTTEGMIL
jgi:wobble nucleotide-excising tRNase